MDPVTLAAGAIALLGPYLARASADFAGEAGKAAWGVASRLFDQLKRSVDGKPLEKSVLENYERDPETLSSTARIALTGLLEQDAALAKVVETYLSQVKALGPDVRVVQRINDAEDVVGVKADRVGDGASVHVEQHMERGKGIVGGDLGTIGG